MDYLTKLIHDAIARKNDKVVTCRCHHGVNWHTALGCRWGAARKGRKRRKCACKITDTGRVYNPARCT